MLVNRVLWLLWLLGSAIAYLYTKIFGAALLFFLSLGVPFVLAFFQLASSKKLHLSLSSQGAIEKGGVASCTLGLDFDSWIPLSRLSCLVEVSNLLTGERQSFPYSLAITPKTKDRVVLNLRSAYCGRLAVTLKNVKLYDCFGLFGIKRSCFLRETVTILPEILPVALASAKFAAVSDAEVYSPYQSGYDYSETFQIREYALGDSPKQIHWKLSQKHNRLLVKDPGLPVKQSRLILWERSTQDVSLSPAVQDGMATVLLSLCQALAQKEIHFKIGWQEPKTGVCLLHEVAGADDFVTLAPCLLGAPPCQEKITALQAYYQLFGKLDFADVVYVTPFLPEEMSLLAECGSGTILLCHSGSGQEASALAPHMVENLRVYPFTADKIPQLLNDLEID